MKTIGTPAAAAKAQDRALAVRFSIFARDNPPNR
jgi:hypothetical protein